MFNKNQKLTQNTLTASLSHDQLVQELQQAKSETIKYVNKFLEAEEKWMFINVLLKQLNSTLEPQKLCETVCDGVLKLTNSKQFLPDQIFMPKIFTLILPILQEM